MRGIPGQWHAEFCIEVKRLVNEYRRSGKTGDREIGEKVKNKVFCGLMRDFSSRSTETHREVKREMKRIGD
jgi:hypothetical protein